MITRAIVEELISPFQIKVRIPLLDRDKRTSTSTSKDNLNVAVVCTLPRCEINLQPGDIVFVAFEENQYDQVVILGVLYKESLSKECPSQSLEMLNVLYSASLPFNTRIGDVTKENIACLTGCNVNIKKELDNINFKIEEIRHKVEGIN